MRRIFFSAAGSAGDLFPVIPIMRVLQEGGHDVRCAVVPRSLGFYLRSLGIETVPVGSGTEVKSLRSPGAVTSRLDGWASLRHLASTLLLPTLDDDLEALEGLTRSWRPDLVVSASFMPSTRILARRQCIAHVDVSIYPLMARLATSTRFGLSLRRRCADLVGLRSGELDSPEVTRLAWGVGPGTLLLHDRALLRHGTADTTASLREHTITGSPSWDDAPHRAEDVMSTNRWLNKSQGPVVMVTMGSYLGIGRRAEWRSAAEVASKLGLRGLFVGPVRELEQELAGLDGDFHVARYVPLSAVLDRVDVLIQHGGTGTMFASIRAGTPSVVRPIAFDQGFNSRLLESAGVGVHSGRRSLADDIELVLADSSFAERCRALALELVAPNVAAERAATRILAAEAEHGR